MKNDIINMTYGEWYEKYKDEIPKYMNAFYIWLLIFSILK